MFFSLSFAFSRPRILGTYAFPVLTLRGASLKVRHLPYIQILNSRSLPIFLMIPLIHPRR